MMIALFLIGGLILLYFGAEFLVKGGVRLATIANVPPLLIGLTVVGFATSAPELVVSVDAALKGSGDISIGNVVGSNICNIALILGLSAVICPLSTSLKIIRIDTPLMIFCAILLSVVLFVFGGIDRITGGIFFAGIILYTLWSIREAKREMSAQTAAVKTEFDEAVTAGGRFNISAALGLIALGLAMLVGGAKLLVTGAVELAHILSIPDAIIGLTIVAVGTSLPELATSVVAAVRGQRDISIGNILGSNIFNVLAIMGVSGLVKPIQMVNIGVVDLGVMLFTSILLLPLMRTGFVISRKEGVFLLAIYAGYTTYLILGAMGVVTA